MMVSARCNVSVVIPAHNAESTLGWTLEGLAAQDYKYRWEAIVVDDGSRDGTGELARGSPQPVRLIRLAGEGAAGARNAGAAAARGEVIAFLDSDCRPSSSWLRAGMAALGSADLVQGAVLPDPAIPLGPFDRTLWVRGLSGLFESANIFVRRDLFEALNGFEGWLVPKARHPLGEDVLFGWRANRYGARIRFCEEALVHHAVFPRSLRGYVSERVRLRFFPQMARRIPELREHFFYRRAFLTRGSAAFDLALAGLAIAALRGSPISLTLTLPYTRLLHHRARGRGRRMGAATIVGDITADTVGLAALIFGSIASQTPVI